MAHPHSTFLHSSIHPGERLHFAIDLQQHPAETLCLPGMSVFSINSPPHAVAQTSSTSHQPRLHSGPGRMSFSCSHPNCPESFGDDLSRNTHEMHGHARPGSPLIVHDSKSSREINPAIVIANMRQSGASEDAIRAAWANPALLHYNCQLMLLEQQNRRRLAVAREELPHVEKHFPTTHQSESALKDYYTQIKLLELQNKKRLLMARAEQDEASREEFTGPSDAQEAGHEASPEPRSAFQTEELKVSDKKCPAVSRQRHCNVVKGGLELDFDHFPVPRAFEAPGSFETHNGVPKSFATMPEDGHTSNHAGPSHQLWLSGPHALQDYDTQRRLIEQQKTLRQPAADNPALQDYQMQLMLLEHQNKKRREAAMADCENRQARKHRKSECDSPNWQDALSQHQKAQVEKGKKPMQQSLQRSHDVVGHVPNGQRMVDWPVMSRTYTGPGPVSVGNFRNSDSHGLGSNCESNKISLPVRTIAEQMTAQQKDMIRRHQANMDGWKRMQQQKNTANMPVQDDKPHPPLPSSDDFSSPSTNMSERHQLYTNMTTGVPQLKSPWNGCLAPLTMCQASTDTHDDPRSVGKPAEFTAFPGRFVVDLPVRLSKQAAEQIDPELDEWAEVQRPQERACSEESEKFE